jgi:glycosyltransferase involved in cell wall biosynthesis
MSMLNPRSRKKNVPELLAAGSGALFATGSPVWLVIPAFNEADVIGQTLLRLPSGIFSHVVVGDNGSSDNTAEVARRAGAQVVSIEEKGYGAACLAVLAEAPDNVILVFLQADGSEDAREATRLIEPILANQADLVIGSRVLGQASRGSLRPHQRFGNWLATSLIALFWGQRLTDLGPFRAIRAGTLRALAMQDRNYGWTVEMQVRAARQRLRVVEIPVRYGQRLAGTEKVSGNLLTSFHAGAKILSVIFCSAFHGKNSANQTSVPPQQ